MSGWSVRMCWSGEAAYPCDRWWLPFRQLATHPTQACLDQAPDDVQLSGNTLSNPVIHDLEALSFTHLRQPRLPDRLSNGRKDDHLTTGCAFLDVLQQVEVARKSPNRWVWKAIQGRRRNGRQEGVLVQDPAGDHSRVRVERRSVRAARRAVRLGGRKEANRLAAPVLSLGRDREHQNSASKEDRQDPSFNIGHAPVNSTTVAWRMRPVKLALFRVAGSQLVGVGVLHRTMNGAA